MAKKKILLWTNRPAGMPAKQCENCGKYYFARYKECPNCQTPNPGVSGVARKTVKKRKKRATTAVRRNAKGSRRGGDVFSAAIEFVKQAGGIEQAKQTLDLVERIKRL